MGIKTATKQMVKKLGLYEYLKSKKKNKLYPVGTTILVHIGKCGGRTLKDGLANASINQGAVPVHVEKPIFRHDLKYIIVARGPISRLISAFRWRYKLVVTEGTQKDRFEGEYDVLTKYRTLNNIAEALYLENGDSNLTAQEDIKKIHHIREDIAFYLEELLDKCNQDQILAVLMQESLDDDIARVFGYHNQLQAHKNNSELSRGELSELAVNNLKKFFHKDFEALTKLYTWNKIRKDIFLELH